MLTQSGVYTAVVADLLATGMRYSAGSNYSASTAAITPVADAGTTYCVSATSASGLVFSYSSTLGMRQAACPAAAPF